MPSKFLNNTVKIVALTTAVICFVVYLQALSCGFVNFDDQDYVLNNTAIRNIDGDFFTWAFTTSYIDWWIPLTWVSFAIDYFFWGLNPKGYHLTNILLHSINTGLVLLIADRLLGAYRVAAGEEQVTVESCLYIGTLMFASLLWALHPLRVEAVVWVTARKDVLNGLFSLGSIIFYLEYVLKKELVSQKCEYIKYYWFSLLLFIFSLLAKPSSVIIPVVLMIADFYPFERFKKGTFTSLLLEKIPFLIISLTFSIATLLAASRNNNLSSIISIGQKIVISGNAIFEYIRLMLFPVGIIPLYFIPAPIPDAYTVKTIIVILLFIAVLVFRKYKALVSTWLYFIVALIPVIGFAQVGTQAFAARFTYLPSIVPSIAAAAMFAYIFKKYIKSRLQLLRLSVLTLFCGSVLVSYVVITEELIGTWKDSGRLWSRQILYMPFDRAFFYRGLFYYDIKKYEAAIADYSTCLKILEMEKNPELFNLYAFRGEASIKAARYADAVNDFNYAIGRYPHPLYFYHRGTALSALGKAGEAEEDFIKAGEAKGQMYWFTK